MNDSAELAQTVEADKARAAVTTRFVGSHGSLAPAAGATSADGATTRYEMRGILGSGGMGVVQLAFDATLGREVAYKVMRGKRSEDGAARFVHEA